MQLSQGLHSLRKVEKLRELVAEELPTSQRVALEAGSECGAATRLLLKTKLT